MIERMQRAARRLQSASYLYVFVFIWPFSVAAAEPLFPAGSHFGLVPPQGFSLAADFKGFLSPTIGASIVIEELPSTEFKRFQTLDMAAGFARIGFTVKSSRPEKIGNLNGVIFFGRQTLRNIQLAKCYLILEGSQATGMISLQVPEKNVGSFGGKPCAALMTVVERSDVGKTNSLPFDLTNMGGMRKLKGQAGGGILLTLGARNEVSMADQPMMIVAPSLGSLPAGDSATVSRNLLADFTGLGNGKIVSENPVQIDRATGYEIIASGTLGNTDIPIAVVQWIRFSENRYIRMIGLARATQRDVAFAAFRKVRDGLRAR